MLTHRLFPLFLYRPDEPVAGDPPAADPPAADPPKADPPKVDEPKDDTVTMPKAEADALRRKVAEGEQAKRAAEKATQEAERKRLEDEGKHQEIAATEKARADAAEAALNQTQRDLMVSKVAGRLKFRDVDDIHLPGDLDHTDEAAVEAALQSIATAKPYLIDTGAASRTGTPAAAGDTTGLTATSIRSMSPEEVAKYSAVELAEAMTRG